MAQLWLRAETYGFPNADIRTPLTPDKAKILVDAGHEIVVERSPHRIFHDEDYEKAGCKMVEAGTWYTDAPPEAFILGIKYLPKQERFEKQFALPHKLIYFAHGWNGDADGSRIISRLEERNLYASKPTASDPDGSAPSPFYDLEDMVDSNGKRVAAFGYYAGYAGTLLSLQVWCQKQLGEKPPYHAPDPAMGREEMVRQLREKLQEVEQKTGKKPSALVIAAEGRCGKGSVGLLKELNVKYTPWTRVQTSKGHPFSEILDHDILLNCVSFSPTNPKFVTAADLKKDIKLSVVGDISCYPGPYNPVDIYEDVTSYANLSHTVQSKSGTVDVIAVENLPQLLAKDSSNEYSGLLFDHLRDLLDGWDKGHTPIVWRRADDKSYKILCSASAIKNLGMAISASCFREENIFDTAKADTMLMEWLERNPLTMTEKAGFNRFLSDGAQQTYKMRSKSGSDKDALQFLALHTWAEEVDIQELCAQPKIVVHHSLETEVDHFLMSAAGRAVMRNTKLRKAYMDIIDAGHSALNDPQNNREKLDKIIEEARTLTQHMPKEGQLILEAFDSIKALASSSQLRSRQ